MGCSLSAPVDSGTVGLGEQVTGAGVLPLTAIDAHLNGSGAGSTWIVNNAQTVAGENMTMTAPPLSVFLNWNDQPIVGATANNDFFNVSVDGAFGYDLDPSSLSYMSGTAAAVLGLTQEFGAINSSPGGQNPTASEFMNSLTTLVQDAAELASITESNGSVEVSAATFPADRSALDKIVGGFDVSDWAANLDLDQLNDPNISAIIISDSGQITVSVAQLTTDATAIGKLQNAGAPPCARNQRYGRGG